ncbi:MAG: CHAT domain-containing protein, partial [Haliscomenobacter sp.]
MPIVFTIFANPHGDLLLTEEQNGIQDALNPLVSSKKIEHLIRTSANLSDFFDFVSSRAKNEFAILHFAGHAHQHILQLQDRQVSFEEMARHLMAHSKESLQLVFLNGCSTHALVDSLLELGVPAVIATSVPVPDVKARDLAIRFYKHIALGDSIQVAYQSAVRYVNSAELDNTRKIEEAIQTRDFVLPSTS